MEETVKKLAMPVLQYRFKFIIDGINEKHSAVITKSVTSCNINHDINIIDVDIVEKLEVNNAQKIIRNLCKHPSFRVNILYTDEAGNNIINNEYIDCKVVFHTLNLTYSGKGVATHKLKIEFEDYDNSSNFDTIEYYIKN